MYSSFTSFEFRTDTNAFYGKSLGVIGSFLSIQTYIIDNYTLHAASALAATSSARSLAGFGFPLFAGAMFDKLGIGSYFPSFSRLA